MVRSTEVAEAVVGEADGQTALLRCTENPEALPLP